MENENKHFTENDRVFYADGYQLVQSVIGQSFSKAGLFGAIETLYAAIDGLNDSIISFSEKQNINIACQKGCHWCCHQAVFANSWELQYLSDRIKKDLKGEEFDNVVKRIESKHNITSKLSEEEVLKFKSPCPLLKEGACSYYAARPMACRIYLSTKLESCLEFYYHPENETSYPALLDFPLRAGRMMNEGFKSALKEIGIETAEFKLEEGLAIVLRNDHQYFE